MAFADYSTNPDQNVSIGNTFVGEGCSPANLNNALRRLAADGKELYEGLITGGIGSAMPRSGGVFTGEITRQGQGAYLRFASPALTSGKVIVQPEGTPLPQGEEGMLVISF